jgi:hypothetical protein
MLKKYLALILVGLLVSALPVWAKSKEEKAAQQAEKIKAAILQLGTGQDARIKLKLRDKSKLAGHIHAAGADSFVIVDEKTGTATIVAYPNVTQVKGNNLSTGAKVAIVLGITAAVLAILLFFENYG